jgi:hypothetical protein
VRTAAAQAGSAEAARSDEASASRRARQSSTRTTTSSTSTRTSAQAKPAPAKPPPTAQRPAQQVARAASSTQAGQGAAKPSSQAAESMSGFPTVTVSRVRWHPDPERRIAWIELEQAGPLEAREGDIVAGVMVRRIDPGAVEVQVGGSKRLIPLSP